jgi:hypothetical protein
MAMADGALAPGMPGGYIYRKQIKIKTDTGHGTHSRGPGYGSGGLVFGMHCPIQTADSGILARASPFSIENGQWHFLGSWVPGGLQVEINRPALGAIGATGYIQGAHLNNLS